MQPAPPAAPPVLDVLPPPLELLGPHRGSGDEGLPTLRLPPGTRFVQLALPELFLADSVTLALRVFAPDGTSMLDARCRYGELNARRTLLFGDPATALPLGEYHLVVGAPLAGEPVIGDFRFALVR